MGAGSGTASPSLQTSSRGFEANSIGQVTAHFVLPEKTKTALKHSLP